MKRCVRVMILALSLLLMLSCAASAEEMAREITQNCRFKVSEGKTSALTDGNVRKGWKYVAQDAKVLVAIPEGENPALMQLYWMFDPVGFDVLEYDADKNLLRQRDASSFFPSIVMPVELMPDTRYIQLRMTAPEQELVEVKLFGEGTLPERVQVWNPPVEKAELMVVSTHQDDELIFFGGTIPYYAVAKEKPTVVVYMANCSRFRRQEALNGLWAMGVRDYPEFINLRDKRVKTMNEGIELWGGRENILNELVQRIRRFKPEVIVTHDFDGEYGHNQHKITAAAMQYAIDAAADPLRFPESANLYGSWQVKKLYIHLYEENQVYMDWQTPVDELGGISPLKAAQIGYEEHASQHKYYQVVAGGKYDNARFGLYFTAVGYDTGKNDFLENLPSALAVSTPEPVAVTPEPTAELEPTAVPALAATEMPVAREGSMGSVYAGIGVAAVIVAGVAGLAANHRKRRRRHRYVERHARRK